MRIYSVVFDDQQTGRVNAESESEAVQFAQERYGKAVESVRVEGEVKERNETPLETLRRGGPNL